MRTKKTFEELSRVVDNYASNTVAHEMALKGHVFTDMKILKLQNDDGDTVAHIMARVGHVFTNPEILKLQNKRGDTVAQEIFWEKQKHIKS